MQPLETYEISPVTGCLLREPVKWISRDYALGNPTIHIAVLQTTAGALV